MSISEQIKELRAYANVSLYARECETKELLKQAADTIEALSAKLADMEHSAEPTTSCGNWCLHWDSINGGCKIHNTIPYGCKDFCSIKMHTMSLTNPSPTEKNTASHTKERKG